MRRRRSGRPSTALRLSAALSVATALAGCGTADEARPAPRPVDAPVTVVVGMVGEPSGFNVHLFAHDDPATRDVVGRLWPSAYRLGADGSYEPSLLSRPATVVSTDPYVLEWQIKAEADWSDGTPVTAADAEYLWARCSTPGTGDTCVEAGAYRQITAFDQLDDKRFRTTFSSPPIDHERLFRAIPPAHKAASRPGGWEHAFDTDPGVSAGPFRFGEWRRGDRIVLERNDQWFGRRPAIERLVVRFAPEDRLIEALGTGAVDAVQPAATVTNLRALEVGGRVRVQVGSTRDLETLTFNLDHPLLADAAVRRALALAVDRTELVESLVGPVYPDAVPAAHRFLTAGDPAFEPHGDPFAERDLDAARATLGAAGFTPTPDGGWERDGAVLELRITTTSGIAHREQAVQLVQKHAGDAGIRLHIENVALDRLDELRAERDFDLLVSTQPAFGSPTAVLSAAYGCDGAANVAGFCDERVEEAIAGAAAAADDVTRLAQVNAAEAILWEALPDLPLHHVPVVVAHDPAIRGVAPGAGHDGMLWNVETWTVATSPN